MTEVQWLLEHSESTAASPQFVWTHMTNVSNCADPPAQFELAGSFADGASGKTLFPGRDPVHWRIRDVREGASYAIESEVDGAVLICVWSSEASPAGGTELTQRVGLAGENAGDRSAEVRAAFGPTLAPGMQRIARLLDEAAGDAST